MRTALDDRAVRWEHLREDERCEDGAIERLVEAEEEVGCHGRLSHVDGAHRDPLGCLHSKGNWQGLQAHFPARSSEEACVPDSLYVSHLFTSSPHAFTK